MESFYHAFYKALQNIGYTHPVHPTLTYVPIGTVIAALIFGMFALIYRGGHLAVSARHCIVLAFIFVFPTMLFGYVDWQYFHGGPWQFVFKMKIFLAALLTVLLFIALLLHRKKEPASMVILFIYILCFLTVVGLGYLGGEIVFGTQKKHTHAAGEKNHSNANGGKEHATAGQKEKITFADDISKIFSKNCTMCHKGDKPPAGLRLDSYEQAMAGSEDGSVIVPGKPEESELVLRIKGKAEPSMPFRQPLLPENTIQTVVRWIEQGAPKGDSEK